MERFSSAAGKSPLRQGRWKVIVTVLGAVAELERPLIVERVKAGLRNARAKGKRLGRPKKFVDAARVAELRAQGLSWRAIGREMGLPAGTVYDAAVRRWKNRRELAAASD
jgi:DNA invertase Pin-like site-specific DNA recombinase